MLLYQGATFLQMEQQNMSLMCVQYKFWDLIHIIYTKCSGWVRHLTVRLTCQNVIKGLH